jgi:hypothetical protein
MCLFNLYRSKKKIIVTGKIQPIGLAAVPGGASYTRTREIATSN